MKLLFWVGTVAWFVFMLNSCSKDEAAPPPASSASASSVPPSTCDVAKDLAGRWTRTGSLLVETGFPPSYDATFVESLELTAVAARHGTFTRKVTYTAIEESVNCILTVDITAGTWHCHEGKLSFDATNGSACPTQCLGLHTVLNLSCGMDLSDSEDSDGRISEYDLDSIPFGLSGNQLSLFRPEHATEVYTRDQREETSHDHPGSD